MRCFFGLRLPKSAQHLLMERYQPLRQRLSGVGGTWVPQENLHLTLRFLGETDARRRNLVTRGLETVFPYMEAPQLRLGDPGLFPPRGSRRLILWAGLEGELPRLEALAQELEARARRAGFAPEQRRFKPHVTLARLPARAMPLLQGASLPALPAEDCTPNEVHLFQSVRDARGLHYPSWQSWPFSPT
ncbi:MAG: RNA 2',3'-cyclic phosphodiesterase [Planctomycetota bacterium]|nr:MAG: RNA 2',3'-cyclic phosphodiesterase [Planctomycetota bacterium]